MSGRKEEGRLPQKAAPKHGLRISIGAKETIVAYILLACLSYICVAAVV